MNKENAKYYLPLLTALSEGKTIQMKVGEVWIDQSYLMFDSNHTHYRIKPERTKIALSWDDIPTPCWIRSSISDSLVISINRDGIQIGDNHKWFSFRELRDSDLLLSIDRKSWAPICKYANQ